MNRKCPTIREGDLYEVLLVDGGTFEIRYGYYEDYERNDSEPIPIYPDLEKNTIYGASGKRIVTHMQEPCSHFKPKTDEDTERCCGCCKHYPQNRQMIEVCQCRHNQSKIQLEGSKLV